MKLSINYRLYLVTDSNLCAPANLPDVVARAIEGGVTMVQLREKTASTLEFYNTALAVKKVTDSYAVPLIINDRLDIALAVDAAGLHIGQDDLPAPVARKLLGAGKIIGVSVGSLAEAIKAEEQGADYLGIGSCFTTQTKLDVESVSFSEIKNISSRVKIPKVGIGGINTGNIHELAGLGLDGVAVVSAIMGRAEPEKCAKELIEKLSEAGI